MDTLDLSHWHDLISRYRYEDENPILNRIRAKGLRAVPEDFDVVNMIALWKLNRVVRVRSETLEFINSVAERIVSPEAAIDDPDTADCFCQAT